MMWRKQPVCLVCLQEKCRNRLTLLWALFCYDCVAAALTLDLSLTRLRGFFMNTDQVKGAVKDAAGKVQSKTGEIIGSPEQQAKGMAKQVEGKAQKNLGDAKEVLKDAVDKI